MERRGRDEVPVVKERDVTQEPDAAEPGETSGVRRTTALRGAWLPVLFLLVIPAALWLLVPVVPFLPVSVGMKAWVVSGLLVSAEVVFWGAALFFGKEIASRYHKIFDPRRWFRKERP